MDRFVRGFIVGVVAATVKDTLNWLSFSLHIAKHTYAEYSYTLLSGHLPAGTIDYVVGQLFELGLGGVLGILFTYYAHRTAGKRNLWFKGVFFALGLYFMTYVTGTLFHLQDIGHLDTTTIISNFITSTVDGMLLGLGVYWWGARRDEWGATQASPKANGKPKVRQIIRVIPAKNSGERGWGHLRRPRKLR